MVFNIDLTNPTFLMTLEFLKIFIISFLLIGLSYCGARFILSLFRNVVSEDFYRGFNETLIAIFVILVFIYNILGDIKVITTYFG